MSKLDGPHPFLIAISVWIFGMLTGSCILMAINKYKMGISRTYIAIDNQYRAGTCIVVGSNELRCNFDKESVQAYKNTL